MSGSSSAVEIDFFRLEGESSPKKLSDRRDIRGVMSKINPEILKTAIASASADTSANMAAAACVAPMTIFFNGSVSVFDVSSNQAESIIKLAESLNSVGESKQQLVKTESNQNQTISRALRNDLPMSRKKSLRRFLEKRKERHVALSPYAYSQESSSSH